MKTILVVEDDPSTQFVYSIWLNEYNMDSCKNATEARNALAKKQYDIVLLDINLGAEMTGLKLLENLIEEKTEANILVISEYLSELERLKQKYCKPVYLTKEEATKDRVKVECQLRLFPFPCGHYGAGKYTMAKLYLLGNILCFLRMI
jgi:CheY-like chemotaxis protein